MTYRPVPRTDSNTTTDAIVAAYQLMISRPNHSAQTVLELPSSRRSALTAKPPEYSPHPDDGPDGFFLAAAEPLRRKDYHN